MTCTGAIGGGEFYGDRMVHSVLKFVTCEGSEQSLLNCPHNTSGLDAANDCGDIQDAHVVCQGICSGISDKATSVYYRGCTS